MARISDPFDAVYYINLQSREDRNNQFLKDNNDSIIDHKKLKRIEAFNGLDYLQNLSSEQILKYEKCDCVHKKITHNILRASHLESYSFAFLDSLNNNYKKILILEDDAVPNFTDPATFLFYESQEDYHALWLGGLVDGKLEKHTDYMYKLNNNIVASHAIAYNFNEELFSFFSQFANNFDNAYKYLDSKFSTIFKNGSTLPTFGATDLILKNLITTQYKCFIPEKIIYKTHQTYSDIERGIGKNDGDHMIREFQKHT